MTGKIISSQHKMLDRVEELRKELGSLIYHEQFKVFVNVSREASQYAETKQKLLEEIIFLTNTINLMRTLEDDITYKEILDDLPQLIIVVNENFKSIYINNWIEQKDSLLGKDLHKIFPGIHEFYPKLENLYNGAKIHETIEIDYASRDNMLSKIKLTVNPTQDRKYIISGNLNQGIDFENSIIGDYISLCSYCDHVKNIFDNWFEMKNVIKLKDEFKFSHGICPDCYRKQIQLIEG